MLRRAFSILVICVAVAVLLYGAAFAWATFTSRPFQLGALPPLPFPSIAPPGVGPSSPLPGAPSGTTPVAAPQPQPSTKSCAGFTLTSFTMSQSKPRQEVAHWATSGGCAPFAGRISWSGQGIQSGAAPISTASGTQTEQISAAPCPPPPTTLAPVAVTFELTLRDASGHQVQQAVVFSVTLC